MALKPHLRLIALIGLIVPRRLRADWRQEWEAELRHRERMLADWDRLGARQKIDLLRRSASAFWDALWLQRQRLEDAMIQDVRFGCRMLAKQPAFTAVAVFTLALGVGANTAIFTLLDKALIRSLPVGQPDRLVALVNENGAPTILSYPKYLELRDRSDVLAGLIAYHPTVFNLSDGGRSERIVGQIVSGNYFAVLGVRPAVGRFFLPEEDRTPGTHPVVVIGHDLWRRIFAADLAIIGRQITVNGYRYTVVGVTPPEFTGASRGTASDVYVPVMMQAEAQPGNGLGLSRANWGWLRAIGRLKPDVTREQAQAALAILMDEPGKSLPGKKDDRRLGKGSKGALLLTDGSRGHTDRVADLSLPLKLLMGVVGLVLLIACANVANLLLARASSRQREMAVRLAVGASRHRIVRQLVTEGTLLAMLGGAASLLIAYSLTGFFLGFEQQTSFVPRTLDGSLDLRALGFTLFLSLLTGMIFSLAPARAASRPDCLPALKNDSAALSSRRRPFSLRNLLVVTEVALSLVVLIGAGLCVKSLRALQAVDPGFEPAKVVTASFNLGMNGYTREQGRQFIADVSDRVAVLPGVETVGLASIVAFSDLFWIAGAAIEGYEPQADERMAFDFNAITPGYFKTLGTPLLSGREFSPQDGPDAPKLVIVNEAVARRYWPGQDPVGKRTNRGEVVGVVRNTKEKGIAGEAHPTFYLPMSQNYVPDVTLHVRTALDPHSVLASVRREIQTLDASLPVYNLKTLLEQRDGSLYTERMAAALLTLFAAIALLLAVVGIYGVLSYSVTERTRELGIRLTQGARPVDLVKLVVGQGMLLAVVGSIVGLAAAFALTRVLQGVLFGVSTTDPVTFVAIPIMLAAVASVACWLPARRATRMSPMAAMRHD